MLLCSRCGQTDDGCLQLFLTAEAELIGRYLPEYSQQTVWCPHCRRELAILIERVQDQVKREHSMPVICCVCHKVLSGAVSHGYCHDCAETEKTRLEGGRPRPPWGPAVIVLLAAVLLILAASCKPLAAILPQHPLNPQPGRIYEIAWPVKVNVYLTNPETGKREIRQMLATPETAWLVGKPEPEKENTHETLPAVPVPGPVPFVALSR